MSSSEESQAADVVEQPPWDGRAQVTAHRSSPDRFVFTEEGNTDGWIATSVTATLRR